MKMNNVEKFLALKMGFRFSLIFIKAFFWKKGEANKQK